MLASTRILLASQKIDSIINITSHGLGLTLFGVMPRILYGYGLTLASFQYDWIQMLIVTFVGMLGQFSLETALKKEKNTSLVAIFFSLGVVFNFILDMVFFSQPFIWRRFWGDRKSVV